MIGHLGPCLVILGDDLDVVEAAWLSLEGEAIRVDDQNKLVFLEDRDLKLRSLLDAAWILELQQVKFENIILVDVVLLGWDKATHSNELTGGCLIDIHDWAG